VRISSQGHVSSIGCLALASKPNARLVIRDRHTLRGWRWARNHSCYIIFDAGHRVRCGCLGWLWRCARQIGHDSRSLARPTISSLRKVGNASQAGADSMSATPSSVLVI